MVKRKVKGKRNIRGIATEYLPWLLIALLVLVIIFLAIMSFRNSGVSFIERIKDIFRRS